MFLDEQVKDIAHYFKTHFIDDEKEHLDLKTICDLFREKLKLFANPRDKRLFFYKTMGCIRDEIFVKKINMTCNPYFYENGIFSNNIVLSHLEHEFRICLYQ